MIALLAGAASGTTVVMARCVGMLDLVFVHIFKCMNRLYGRLKGVFVPWLSACTTW